MASRRRAQEEKNLKILRELVSLPSNKQCFDCLQRGPTYVNVTIGSFICTSCSGILRGLTPPHRVKSITMTTFTPEEIEFIKNRGNEYCQYVWLGTYDSRTNLDSETRDEQRIREFMIQKYERKRWYVDPEISIKKMQQDQQNSQAASVNAKKSSLVPETKPLTSLLGKNFTPLVIHNNQNQSSSPWQTSTTTVSSQCTSTVSNSQAQGDLTANGNFANFENAFNNAALSPQSSQSHHQRKAYTPPAGWTSFDDDLDPLFSTAPPPSQRHPSHNVPPRLEAHSQSQSSSSTVMPRPLSLPTFTPTNPFTSPLLNPPEISTPSQWPSFPTSNSTTLSTPTSTVCNTATFTSQSFKTDAVIGLHTDFSMPSVTTTVQPSNHLEQQQQHHLSQQSAADRYAALADLDSLFHQGTEVSPTVSSWTVSTTSSSIFGSPTSVVPTTFATASSNPFSNTSISWSQSISTQPHDLYSCANPFQASMPLSNFTPQSTSTASSICQYEGSSISNACNDNRFPYFGSNMNTMPFSSYATEGVSSPSNGMPSTQFGVQNGGFGISQMPWGLTSGTSSLWPTSQQNQLPSFPATKLTATATQFDVWKQTAANPFLGGHGTAGVMAPRLNPGNPFL